MLIWDFVLMIVSFYNLFIIPYEICFDLDAYSQHHSWLNKISLIVYFMDMMISMNTGNYIKGKILLFHGYFTDKSIFKLTGELE